MDKSKRIKLEYEEFHFKNTLADVQQKIIIISPKSITKKKLPPPKNVTWRCTPHVTTPYSIHSFTNDMKSL